MTDLFYENYDGEMLFDIENLKCDNDSYSFDIKAIYDGQIIGMNVKLPVIIRKSLFKTLKFLKPNGKICFESLGEESDNFIKTIEKLFKAPYKSSGQFTDEAESLDFSVLNRQIYDLDNDKIYIKIFNGEDQSDFDEDEKVNIELNFSFNLSTKRASIIEVREGYSADLVATLMK